jgi:hypothetical protein
MNTELFHFAENHESFVQLVVHPVFTNDVLILITLSVAFSLTGLAALNRG